MLGLVLAAAVLLAPGGSVDLRLPAGNPDVAAVEADFRVDATGPYTIDVHSLAVDPFLEVIRVLEDGTVAGAGDDDDSGPWTDARVVNWFRRGEAYRIRVTGVWEDDPGGNVTVTVTRGAVPESPSEIEVQEDARGVAMALAEADRTGRPEIRARALAAGSPDPEVARKRLLEALHLYTSWRGPDCNGALASRIAIVRLEALAGGNPGRVLVELGTARALAARRHGEDHPFVLGLDRAIADELWAANESDRAMDGYRNVLERLSLRLGEPHLRVRTLRNELANKFAASERLEEAAEQLETEVRSLERALGPDSLVLADGLRRLGRCRVELGQVDEARERFDRVVAIHAIWFGADSIKTADASLSCWSGIGETVAPADVEPVYRRVVDVYEREAPESERLIDRLFLHALMLVHVGRLPEAERQLRRSIDLAERVLGTRHETSLRNRALLSTLLSFEGKGEAALEEAHRIVDAYEQLGDLQGRCRALLAEGGLLVTLERPADAVQRLEAGLACLDGLQVPGFELWEARSSLAEALYKLGRMAEARAVSAESVATGESLVRMSSFYLIGDLSLLAHIDAALGEFDRAMDEGLRATHAWIDFNRRRARALAEDRATPSAEGIRHYPLGAVLDVLARRRPIPSDVVRRGWDALVRSRALVLDETAARNRWAAEASAGGERAAEALRWSRERLAATDRLARLLAASTGASHSRESDATIAEARRRVDEAEEQLGRASATYRDRLASDRVGFEDVRAALPDGAALVAYARFGEPASYIALVLAGRDREPEVVALGAATPIDAAVERWRRDAAAGAGLPSYRIAADALRAAAWDPVARRIGNAGRVFLVPDGSLNLVNFGALPAGPSRYLVEIGPVFHLLSAERDLVPRNQETGRGLLAIGGAAYDASVGGRSAFRGRLPGCSAFGTHRFGPLPATEKEAREIASLWTSGGATALTGAAASETAFKTMAPGRRALHLATHGFTLAGDCSPARAGATARGIGGTVTTGEVEVPEREPGGPLRLSGLAFAGANRRAAAGPGVDDGILTAEEIAALDLSGVEWAVLSGCDTGLGDIRAVEGVFGLRRAFQVAGARTLITSLWAVDDDSTRDWMTALYRGRLERGLDTVDAVREASLSVLRERRAKKLSTHPFYWAAFVASGDWR